MKKLNKKGIDYMAWFTLGFIIIFFMLSSKLDILKLKTGEIGITQTAIEKAQYNSEEALFFIGQASKYSIYNSLYELAENGGFKGESGCGKYKDFNIWNISNENCYPRHIQLNFNKYLQNNLNLYIEKARIKLNQEYCNYPFAAEKVSMPKNNYDFLIEDNGNNMNITGIPTISLAIDICAEFQDKKGNIKSITPIGKFFIKPQFFHKVDYTFNDYKKIEKKIIEIEARCETEKDIGVDDDLTQCIYGKMGPHKGLNWKVILQEGRNFAIEVNSDKKMPSHNKNIIYKFAISLPDEYIEPEEIEEPPATTETPEAENPPEIETIS